MNEQGQEKKLRALFEEAHRGDRAPPFRRTWEAAHASNPTRRPLWVAVPAAVAVALLVVWTTRPQVISMRAEQQVPSLEWNAPLDFLLQTPGSELLHTVPTLGEHRNLP